MADIYIYNLPTLAVAPDDADYIIVSDTSDSNTTKKLAYSNLIGAQDYRDYTPVDPDTISYSEGRVFYDQDDDALTVMTSDSDVRLQIGQETHIKVTNKTGSTITNGSAVYINGVQGNRPTIALAIANNPAIIRVVLGVVTADIENNESGFVTTFGIVRGIDTSSWNAGDLLYLSGTVAGEITNVRPDLATERQGIGAAFNSTENGDIGVWIRGQRVENKSGTVDGQMSFWDNTNKLWDYTEVTELFWDDTNKRLGIGTNTPTSKFEIVDSSNPQFQISYDETNYAKFQVDENGYLIINPTGLGFSINPNGVSISGHFVVGTTGNVSANSYSVQGLTFADRSGNDVSFNRGAAGDVLFFASSANGENKQLIIYGYPTGTQKDYGYFQIVGSNNDLKIGTNHADSSIIFNINTVDAFKIEIENELTKKTISGLIEIKGVKTLADDATYPLITSTKGTGTILVGDNEEKVEFAWETNGTVLLLSNTYNVVTTNTDGKFCIYNNSGTVNIINKLGASKDIQIGIRYS